MSPDASTLSAPQTTPRDPGKIAVAVVDYGLANIQSVVNALECFSAEVRIALTGEELVGVDKIVLPGVGHFDEGMRGMRARGHDVALDRLVRGRGVPLLGICLGFQFLFAGSEEGSEAGLGWVDGYVRRIKTRPGLKIPHMGWSEVSCSSPTRLFAHLKPPFEFYFVHSYAAENTGEAAAIAAAICDYGEPFVAALERDNIFATQFHPEKSQLAGMKLLETFLAL
jgi:imidazole glycerol-phosphate synthase subunit HisH